MASVTGSVGASGSNTYFSSPIYLGVNLSSGVYPNGTISFDNLSASGTRFHNAHVDNHRLYFYLCDSNGNNAVQFANIVFPKNADYTTNPSMSISGATALAGKKLYIKATCADNVGLNQVYLRGKLNLTIHTKSLKHTITLSSSVGGSLTASTTSAAAGTTVTLYPAASTGYYLEGYMTSAGVTISGNTFTMPDEDVTISAGFAKYSYAISTGTSPSGAGTVSTSASTATYGDTVTISQSPATGYMFIGWFSSPDLGLNASSSSFTMPAQDVSITALYLRRSTATLTSTTLTAGGYASMQISSENAAYTHKYVLSFGGSMTTGTVDVAAGISYVNIPIPMSWCNSVTNATTKSGGTLTLYTYTGTTQIASAYTISNLTFAVPASVVPSVGTITTSIARTIGGTTYANVGNYYVQNHSGVRVQASGSGSYGSTIGSMSIAVAGYTGTNYNKSQTGSSLDFTTGLLTVAGTATITVTATDSRGRTASKTAQITVTAYSAPSANLTVKRVDENGDDDDMGQYAKYGYANLSWSQIGSNTLTKTLIDVGTNTSEVIVNSTGDVLPSNRKTYQLDREYQVQLRLQDAFESTTFTARLRSASFVIFVSANGDKIGFMKATTNPTTGTKKNIEFPGNDDAQIYIGSVTLEQYIRNVINNS